MAVLAVQELYESRSTELKTEGKLSHTRAFIVQTSKDDASLVAATAAGIPAIGDGHADGQSRVASVAAKTKGGEPGVFVVTVKYNNDMEKEKVEEIDPVSQDQTESWGTEERTHYATTDKGGNEILNSAGDRYDEPIEVPQVNPTLTIKRNEPYFNASTAFSYNNSLNDRTFRGGDQGKWRVRITAEQSRQDFTDYWKVTYVFSYNENGWQPNILEAGLYQKYDAARTGAAPNIVRSPCTEHGDGSRIGTPVRQPVPLDALGKQIDPDTLPGTAVYTQWDIYHYINFDNLGLG